MVRTTLLVVAASLLVAAEPGEEASQKDLKKFQGTWVLVSGEKEGKKLSDEEIKQSKITWKGTEVHVDTPHQSKETIRVPRIKLDATKQPGEMEWVRSAGPGAETGMPFRAIYEFLGDNQYRVCFAPPGKERPKEFRTSPGSGHILHVWKRAQ